MEGLNKIFCGSDVKNTGICECFFDPKLIVGAIFVPLKKVFTETELADANIAATMTAAVSAAKASRIFPFQPFEAITDNTEEPTRQTFGYGTVKTVREGKYNWAFQFLNGGLNLSNALRTFNGLIGKYAVVFIESSNVLIGTNKRDTNGNWGLAGIPMSDIYTRPWRPSDGTNVANYTTEFSFDPAYINEKIAFKKVSVDEYILSELAGLEEIKLVAFTQDEAPVNTFRAETDCGSTDVYDLFADELAQAAAWTVTGSDGEDKPVGGVIKNDALKAWDVTLSGGANFEDGDKVQLAAPSILAAEPVNIVGYEGVPLVMDMGS